MPLTEKGEKILENMKSEYGTEKGEQVFYASINEGKITGVDNCVYSNYDPYSIPPLVKEK